MTRSMGKGSVQVTFSKRRVGLMKRAHEMSVLCHASVALVIFSSKGDLYEYSTDSNMQRILERYEQCIYVEKALPPKEPLSQEELSREYRELKRKVDAMQRSQSHAMGENLDTLSMIELQQLELSLETALKCIRSQMNQILLESIAEFQRKEKSLVRDKALVENELAEMKKTSKNAQEKQAKVQSDLASSSTPPTLLLIDTIDSPSTSILPWTLRPAT